MVFGISSVLILFLVLYTFGAPARLLIMLKDRAMGEVREVGYYRAVHFIAGASFAIGTLVLVISGKEITARMPGAEVTVRADSSFTGYYIPAFGREQHEGWENNRKVHKNDLVLLPYEYSDTTFDLKPRLIKGGPIILVTNENRDAVLGVDGQDHTVQILRTRWIQKWPVKLLRFAGSITEREDDILIGTDSVPVTVKNLWFWDRL